MNGRRRKPATETPAPAKKRRTPPNRSDDEDGNKKKPKTSGPSSSPIVNENAGRNARQTSQRPTERRRARESADDEIAVPADAIPVAGNETDFSRLMKLAERSGDSTSFAVSTRALLRTLKAAKHIKLDATNTTFCAECRGGGDLLLCDCCTLSFHPECVEEQDRNSCLFVPVPRHSLKAPAPRNGEGLQGDSRSSDSQQRDAQLRDNSRSDGEIPSSALVLKESEWYCPYCLSPPVLQMWKRGVPQLLQYDRLIDVEAFGGSGWLDKTRGEKRGSSDKPRELSNVRDWMNRVKDFFEANPDSWTPEVLVALSGIRRAIQRHAALFTASTRAEQAAFDVAEPPSATAEPQIPVKAPIMRSGKKEETTEEEEEEEPAAEEGLPRRSRRRGRGLQPEVKPGGNGNGRGPVPSSEPVQARVNVGSAYQVPAHTKHFLEAHDLGTDYGDFDRSTYRLYLPTDPVGRVCTNHNPSLLLSLCRLVYSRSQLEAYQERAAAGENVGAVPMNDDELDEYIRQAMGLWPVWTPWPASPEFVLKILHHCRYDSNAALRLLVSESLQFRVVCDPPTKPYYNKWRPLEKRGNAPTAPFPPTQARRAEPATSFPPTR